MDATPSTDAVGVHLTGAIRPDGNRKSEAEEGADRAGGPEPTEAEAEEGADNLHGAAAAAGVPTAAEAEEGTTDGSTAPAVATALAGWDADESTKRGGAHGEYVSVGLGA